MENSKALVASLFIQFVAYSVFYLTDEVKVGYKHEYLYRDFEYFPAAQAEEQKEGGDAEDKKAIAAEKKKKAEEDKKAAAAKKAANKKPSVPPREPKESDLKKYA